MPVAVVELTLAELQARERRAWQQYAETCFNPLASDEQRRQAFHEAMVAQNAVADRERF